ncbi:hypothetical protein M434DRAFT_394154 [Hypoxylon sp. CO27-5]|nr:hypothetical protein M434DRAFT_394154 [Hypoxylon sp. CO27-5]
MISLNLSRLRGRYYNELFRAWVTARSIKVPSRASSLSAIHRGLRNSEKARPQGFQKTSLNTAGSSRTSKPSFKIRKGKKDITDTGPKAKSRRARFYDPDESFGKKSLVYQLKSGNLRDKLAGLSGRGKPAPKEREGTLTRAQFMKDFESSPGKKFTSNQKNDRTPRSSTPARKTGLRERSAFSSRPTRSSGESRSFDRRDSTKTGNFTRSTRDGLSGEPRSFDRRDSTKSGNFTRSIRDGLSGRDGRREERNFQSSRERQEERQEERQDQRQDQRQAERREERDDHDQISSRRVSSRDHGPVRIHRTTAASQFLYGQSVVEAALKETTRKLYKLYLYCGENRRDASRVTGLERKAEKAGVPVTKVMDSDGLRMMDKMSEGRPHNGCILEASPLPQLPVKSLGSVTEEPTSGFNVTLAYQSSEEAQVNGTSNFIKTDLPPNRKPFVLLLDGIQDPGNLGAILRSAAFLGVNAVGITKGHSATLTSVALKASAGASEVIKLFSTDSILDFLTRSKEEGWLVYAAVAPTDRPRGGKHVTLDRIDSYDPLSNSPTILVIGSEGEGLTGKTRRMADYEVSIPNQSGLTIVDSLNVSVATGILCSAFLKKQHAGGEFDKVIEPQDDESQSQLW